MVAYVIAFVASTYFSLNYIQHTQNQVQLFFTGLGIMAALYYISLTYRNFLTEYSLSYGRLPSWLYFSWNLPGLGFLTWFVALFTFKNVMPLSERIKLHQSGKYETNASIKFLFMFIFTVIAVYQLNRLGLRVDAPSSSASLVHLFGLVISFALMLWYFNHPSGIWAIIIFVFCQVIYYNLFGSTEPNRYGSPSASFANIFTAVVYFSLFHLALLKNVAILPFIRNEEEE